MPVIDDVIIWTNPEEKFEAPQIGVAESAVRIREDKDEIIKSALIQFQGELPETDVIGAMAYGDAVSEVAHLVENGQFSLDRETLCAIHSQAAKHRLGEGNLGKFRDIRCHWHGVVHLSPPPEELEERWEKGLADLKRIDDPFTQAVITFAWLMRMQFFRKCNKRTAMLMMIGLMGRAGLRPVWPHYADFQRFGVTVQLLLELGGADVLLPLMKEYSGVIDKLCAAGREEKN